METTALLELRIVIVDLKFEMSVANKVEVGGPSIE